MGRQNNFLTFLARESSGMKLRLHNPLEKYFVRPFYANFSNMAHVFTDANFNDEVIKSSTPVLVDFWAPWCGPCQMMGPIMEELATEFEGKNIKIGKVNVDENNNVAGQYNVMSIPSFMVFKDGSVVDQLTGGVQKEKLKAMIEKYL